MPENKKEDEFADLPDPSKKGQEDEEGDGGQGDGSEGGEGKGEPSKNEGKAPKKTDDQGQDEKDKKYQKLIADRDRAVKEERRKNKELERKLAEVTKEAPKKGEDFDDDDEEEVTPSTPSIDPKKIADDVLGEVSQRQYNEKVVSAIKAIPGINRAEAQELRDAVGKLPKSGDPQQDVKAARSWLTAMRGDEVSGPPIPIGGGFGVSIGGGGRAKREPTEQQRRYGEEWGGLSKEDYEKYGHGQPKLGKA